MKKIAVGIGIVVVIAAVAIAVYMGVSKKPILEQLKDITAVQKDTPASVIPQDAVLYLGLYNIRENWETFKKSNFWKDITALPLWQDIQFQESLAAAQQDFKAQTGLELNEANIMELFGQEFAFAIFMNNERQQAPSAVLLSKVGAKTRLLSKLLALTDQTGQKFETIDYNGTNLYYTPATEANPVDMTFTIVQNMLVLEIGEQNNNIKAVIDMIKSTDKTGSLKSLPKFRRVTDQDSAPHSQVLYVNAKAVVDAVDAGVIPEAFQDEAVSAGIKNAMSSLDTIGGSTRITDGMYSKYIMIPNYNTDNEQLKEMWHAQPEPSKSLSLAPEETILFSSTQSLNLAKAWDVWQENLIRQNADQANAIMTTINAMETNLDLSLRNDVFPVLGSEMGYFVSDVDVQGFIPIPKLGAFFKITDTNQANRLMARIVAAINEWLAGGQPVTEEGQMLRVDATSYMDVPVNVIRITQFPVPGLTPSYAVIGDELVIASNSATLQDVIAVSKGKKAALRKAENFNRVNNVFTEKNNQMSFINIELAVNKLSDICRWVIDLQESAGDLGQLDPDTMALIKNNLIPFIQSFKSIKALGANTVYTNTGIEKVIVYKVEDF